MRYSAKSTPDDDLKIQGSPKKTSMRKNPIKSSMFIFWSCPLAQIVPYVCSSYGCNIMDSYEFFLFLTELNTPKSQHNIIMWTLHLKLILNSQLIYLKRQLSISTGYFLTVYAWLLLLWGLTSFISLLMRITTYQK